MTDGQSWHRLPLVFCPRRYHDENVELWYHVQKWHEIDDGDTGLQDVRTHCVSYPGEDGGGDDHRPSYVADHAEHNTAVKRRLGVKKEKVWVR